MSEKSIIIIGAGLAGLSTGCYAQMNGYQSHILEHHSQPGGVAAAWKRRDYLIDGGIHFVMGHKPGTGLYELYRQLGIVPANRFVDLTT
jgi:phytoene dehydrogenase-like protein